MEPLFCRRLLHHLHAKSPLIALDPLLKIGLRLLWGVVVMAPEVAPPSVPLVELPGYKGNGGFGVLSNHKAAFVVKQDRAPDHIALVDLHGRPPFRNVSFFSAKPGWDGKSYYPPCFRPRKAPVYKGFSGPKCPHAVLCRRIYSRCRLRFATSLQASEQKARLPCRGNSLPQTAQARSSALWPGPDKARASSGARGRTASRK